MENRRVLVDTSIIIAYLRKKNKENTEFIRLYKSFDLCISSITVFELFNGASTAEKEKEIELICQNIEIIDFNLAISKKASELFRKMRKENKLIEFRDILIGATAIEHEISIATKNKKHFERISNIQLID